MKTDWEVNKNKNKKLKLNLFLSDFEQTISMAPDNDKEYTFGKFRFKLMESIKNLPQLSPFLKAPPGTIPNLIHDIKDLIRTNKNHNFSTAFVRCTPGCSYNDRLKVIELLSDNEAHHEFFSFIEEQWKNRNIKKIETSLDNQDNNELMESEKLTMKQQLLLLQSLGILEIEVIKKLENTKKSKLFSALLGCDDVNIRKTLSYINDNSIRTVENIKRVNDVLIKSGLDDLKLNKLE